MNIFSINAQRGFVMVTVIAMIIVMMVITVGVLGRVTSQGGATDEFVKETQARGIAQGKWWEVHSALARGDSCATINDYGTEVLDGITYTYAVNANCSSTPIDIDVDVDW